VVITNIEMEKIGTGFRAIGDKLIVKLSTVPEMNTVVYTEDGREVGKVVDIIGPSKAPFCVVTAQSAEEHLGKTIAVK
jgi:rRNA processing protein Gar1